MTRSSPLGIAGSGARAAAIAERIASAASTRIIIHGFEPPPGAAGKRPRIERAANLFDLASECEVVIAVYETHAHLIEALAGSADRPGLVTAMAPGTLLVDFSTGTPEECRRLAGQLSPRAIGLVECGHVGDDAAIVRGGAMIFAGGFDEHIESVKPILLALGRVTRIGPQGSGRMFAALSAAVQASHAMALEEAHAIAAANGFVPDDLAQPPLLDAERTQLIEALSQARAIALAQRIPTPVFDAVSAALARPLRLMRSSD